MTIFVALCMSSSTYGAAPAPRRVFLDPTTLDALGNLARTARTPKAHAASLRRLSARGSRRDALAAAHRSSGKRPTLLISSGNAVGEPLPHPAAASYVRKPIGPPPVIAHLATPPLYAVPTETLAVPSEGHFKINATSTASTATSPSRSTVSGESTDLLSDPDTLANAAIIYAELRHIVGTHLEALYAGGISADTTLDTTPICEGLNRSFYDTLQSSHDLLEQETICSVLIAYAAYFLVTKADLICVPGKGVLPRTPGSYSPAQTHVDALLIAYLELVYDNLTPLSPTS